MNATIIRLKALCFCFLAVATLTFQACTCNCPEETAPKSTDIQITDLPGEVVSTENYSHIIADSMMYSTTIKACEKIPEAFVKTLHRKALVDFIFDGIYAGKLKAYDYLSGEPISSENLIELEQEEGFHRDLVGQIFFNEAWYMDPETGQMIKKVHSMVLGYELFRSDGELKGYKAIFRVETGE